MSLTVSQVYSVRFGTKLPLPKVVQDNIALLRITPVSFKPFRPAQKHAGLRAKQSLPDNWREKVLVECIRRVKEYDDPEYSEIFGIFNKIAIPTVTKLSSEVLTLMQKRDEPFRMRVITLLFNKAINEHAYASLMSDCAKFLCESIPEIRDDLQTQIELFPKLYDMTETLVYPSVNEPGFDDKVVSWMKQKDRRRGYSKFMTQLFVRSLVSEKVIHASLTNVISDLNETARQARTSQTEENTTHFVDFLFESAKVLPFNASNLRVLIRTSLVDLLNAPRTDLLSLCMRSRFKAEDTLKCVQ